MGQWRLRTGWAFLWFSPKQMITDSSIRSIIPVSSDSDSKGAMWGFCRGLLIDIVLRHWRQYPGVDIGLSDCGLVPRVPQTSVAPRLKEWKQINKIMLLLKLHTAQLFEATFMLMNGTANAQFHCNQGNSWGNNSSEGLPRDLPVPGTRWSPSRQLPAVALSPRIWRGFHLFI